MGTLYLVSTPIGNLEDLTLRALRMLREASLIAAEDMRHTQRLLDRYEISTPCLAYHEHNKLARLDDVLTALANGDVALVSDAGTPAMSAPGFELINACIAADFAVVPVPGPSAPIAQDRQQIGQRVEQAMSGLEADQRARRIGQALEQRTTRGATRRQIAYIRPLVSRQPRCDQRSHGRAGPRHRHHREAGGDAGID